MTKTLKLIIYGFVQGVGFRWMIQEKAKSLDLVGYAINNYDGTVTVELQGSDASIALFINWLDTNPSPTRIDKIEKTERESEELFSDFEIKF